MPWFAWLMVGGYASGWLVYVVANRPTDSVEGALLIFTGVAWPVFFLGWLASRPFR